MTLSTELIQSLPKAKKHELFALVNEAQYRWSLQARDKQKLPPGEWFTWLISAGRGFGKTRTGAETVRIWKEHYPIIHLVGATAGDVRDIMVEGESGILNISPDYDRPTYEPSKRKLTWNNGAKAILFSADEPDRLRGPQCYKAWADELAAWRYPEAWDQLNMGLRLGDNPQVIVTTTPRPTKIIKELVKDKTTHLTNGTSYENKDNLSPQYFHKIIKKYEGTRIGRQELMAEILEDIEGALWKQELIERYRVDAAPEIKRGIVAIDPAVTSNKDSDETGIIVAGIGYDNHCYIFADKSGRYAPNKWARIALYEYSNRMLDQVVGEANNGGDIIRDLIRSIDPGVNYKSVHASRGKTTRAEPIVGLYEQGKIHHVGVHEQLEEQMTTWNAAEGEKSPDRVDALVWAVHELMIGNNEFGMI